MLHKATNSYSHIHIYHFCETPPNTQTDYRSPSAADASYPSLKDWHAHK